MKKLFQTLYIIMASVIALSAQQAAPALSPWSLTAAPSVSFPLFAGDGSSDLAFATAWGGSLGATYDLPTAFPLALRMGASYSVGGFLPSQGVAVPGSLNEAMFLGGIGVGKNLTKALSAHGFLDAGLAYGSLSSGVSAAYAAARVGGGLGLALGHDLFAQLNAEALYKVGLYGGIGATLGVGYRLPVARASQGLPARVRLLELSAINLRGVFPILRSWYDLNPVGTVRISNTGKEAATNVRVSFVIKQYMDAPKECATLDRIEPGKSIEVPLYGLFNDRILDVTEATKVTGEVSIEYGIDASLSRSATVVVNDRNALTWDDDRKAAAFVSSRDPWVLDLSGNFISAVKSSRNAELAKNLQTAIAIHEGLRAFGIGYMLSTTRPFEQAVLDPQVVDTLKFPRQTLGFRAGDCADLSVLYASCFEAAGVETAFVTIPGHILMAIDLGMTRDEVKTRAIDQRDLILQGDRFWLPLETTMRDSGILDIWKKGAQQWRDASAKGTAAFYPTHDAWKTYAPMGLPADGSNVAAPPHEGVLKAFQTELAKAVDLELGTRLAVLGALDSKGSPNPKALNDRGVLYGKYGRLPDAERDFKAAAKANYLPSIINLGNVSMLKSDPTAAFGYFQQAAKLSPGNARLLVSLAKSAAALGKTDVAAATLEQVRLLDPKAAEQNASLAQVGTSGTRAAAVDEGGVVWF